MILWFLVYKIYMLKEVIVGLKAKLATKSINKQENPNVEKKKD